MGDIWLGILASFTLSGLASVFIGTIWGIIAGALPGVTASMGMALALPFAIGMEPVNAFMMLAGVYVGAEYGGSIPAILIGTPGQPANAPAALDGFVMHQHGESGKAMAYSLTSGAVGSFIGGIIAITMLMALARVALLFGPPDFFALAVFGLSAVVSMSSESFSKGFASVLFGLLLGCIGGDINTGIQRFTFGLPELSGGLNEVPVVIGLVAASEIVGQVVKQVQSKKVEKHTISKLNLAFITFKEMMATWKVTLLSSIIGVVIGVMPGAGPTIASFIAYNEGRRISKDGKRFGEGVPDAIVAPEAANNACVPATFVPLIAFGIPGSTSAAIMLGAMIMHGLKPGPLFMSTEPAIMNAIFLGVMLAAIANFVVGRILFKPWVLITSVPVPQLYASILALMVVGALSLNEGVFPVYLMLMFGVIGYLMKVGGFSPISAVLAFVLEGMIETNFRRALLLSEGSYAVFFTSPISLVLLILTAVSVFFGMRSRKKAMIAAREQAAAAEA